MVMVLEKRGDLWTHDVAPADSATVCINKRHKNPKLHIKGLAYHVQVVSIGYSHRDQSLKSV